VKPTCDDFDRLTDPRSTAGTEEREGWRRHLEECADCRQQMEADRLLRSGLASTPDLGFSAGFEASLRRRLSERRPPRSPGRGARWVLGGYATAAAGLSVWILGQIDWPSSLSLGSAGILLALAAGATPFLLLPRSSPLVPPGPD
jgi:hypothetical protein